MAILNSLDLLAQKTIVQVNEINTKLTVPNGVGDTVKIDASDHREVETAILNLVGNIIESTYNKLDGILLSEIITGDDGDMLQWDAGTTSWVTIPGSNALVAGNLYEIQINNDPAFGASSNLLYDFDLNDFKVLNSTALFGLEATGTKNFVITKDALSINNLLQIDSTSDVITIGATDSTVKLQRGPSALDESLTLTTDLLNSQNTNVSIKTASSITGDGFKLLNGASSNLKTYSNDGKITRTVNIPVVKSPLSVTTIENENITLTVGGGTGTAQVIGKQLSYNVIPEAGVSQAYFGQRIIMSSSNLLTNLLTPVTAYGTSFNANVTSAIGFLSNASIVSGSTGSTPLGDSGGDNPNIVNGWAYMSSSTKIGCEINRYSNNQVSSLIRLKKANLTGSTPANTITAPVGSGISIDFDQVVSLNSTGITNRTVNDKIGSRIAVMANADAFATSELFFKTTEVGTSVEPLLLTGKNITIGVLNSIIKLVSLPVAADNAAALAIPLPVNTVYRTSTGELRIVI